MEPNSIHCPLIALIISIKQFDTLIEPTLVCKTLQSVKSILMTGNKLEWLRTQVTAKVSFINRGKGQRQSKKHFIYTTHAQPD